MTTPCHATSTSFDASSRSDWMNLSPTQRLHVLARLNSDELDAIASDWKLFAHSHQWPPDYAANGRADAVRFLCPNALFSLDRKYNPNQPRVPAGNSDGG
jgi:hypothetical protein